MAILARKINVDRNIGQLLDDVLADACGMQRRAAAGQNDAGNITEFGRVHIEAAKFGGAFFIGQSASHGVTDRIGLLADFLEHVVRVIAFFDVFGGKLDFAHRMLPRCPFDRTDLETFAVERDEIEIVEVNYVPGVRDNRADIAREEILVFADAEDERAPSPGADYEIGNVRVHECDPVSPNDLLQRIAGGVY